MVRSTRPCSHLSSQFVPPREFSAPRTPAHIAGNPDYPHPELYLSPGQKYFFRHASLRHLRMEHASVLCRNTLSRSDFPFLPKRRPKSSITNKRHRQVNRYYSSFASLTKTEETNEDTINDDDAISTDACHRHFDAFSERQTPGQKFKAAVKGVEPLTRRTTSRLGVARHTYLEPIGKSRDTFFEQELVFLNLFFAQSPPLPRRKSRMKPNR